MAKINPNHQGQEGSINELMGQPILNNSLDSSVLTLNNAIKHIGKSLQKGVTADHRKVILWLVMNDITSVANLLDKVSKGHSVGKDKDAEI